MFRDWIRFNRDRDWLRPHQSVLGWLAVAFAVVGGATLVALFRGDTVCTELRGVTPTVEVPGLLRGATPGAAVSVCTDSPTVGQSILAFLVQGLWPVIVAIAAVLLHRIVRDAGRTDPFTPATVRRLRRLALFVILAGGVAAIAGMIAADALAASFVDGAFHPGDISVVPWLLSGFGLAAVAEVLNRGVALRTELDTVI
jgi:hypothetical protein